jgi:hypothetical protein
MTVEIGTRTTDFTFASSLDEIMGNQNIGGVRRTRRVTFADLASQLVSTGAVAAALGVLSTLVPAGSRIKALYTQLAALTGWAEGDTGFVFGDTAALNGEYLYTGGQLVRQKPLPGDVAEAAANAAIAAAAQIVALLDAQANGDLSVVTCPLWRLRKAIAALGDAAIIKWETSIDPSPANAARIAIASNKPVRNGDETWAYTQDILSLTDAQMTSLLVSALAIAL